MENGPKKGITKSYPIKTLLWANEQGSCREKKKIKASGGTIEKNRPTHMERTKKKLRRQLKKIITLSNGSDGPWPDHEERQRSNKKLASTNGGN